MTDRIHQVAMKLFIPSIGTELILAKDWTFSLWAEYRNFDAMQYWLLTKEEESNWDLYREDVSYPITLVSGTVLKVDRIYIRKGSKDFDSVTFFMKGVWTDTVPSTFRKTDKKVRFWAKLDDVNKIEIKDLSDDI